MDDLHNRRYSPVGSCIYCGATSVKLTDEHILPLGLSGTALLPKASCENCAKITSQQERLVMRESMWPLRVLMQLRSRRKHKDAPNEYPVVAVRDDGTRETVMLPASRYPVYVPFPIFPEPATLVQPDEPYEWGIKCLGNEKLWAGPRGEDVCRDLGVKSIEIELTDEPVALARVVAKIAYAWAVAEGEMTRTTGPVLCVPSLLGQREDIGLWVGTSATPRAAIPGSLHYLRTRQQSGYLVGEVQLFSMFATPIYRVVLAKLAAAATG